VESVDHALLYTLRSEQARQETVTYLHEIVDYLADQGKPAAMLVASSHGDTYEAVTAAWECSEANVDKHIKQCRHRLRTWASWSAA
jgi:predicted deacylase